MRTLGLVVAFLATLSMLAAAQAPDQARTSSNHSSSNHSSYPAKASPDTNRTASGNPDPYLERYYSHSEGWTYYNLPPDSIPTKSLN
jgi:hypothetical protein